MTQTLRDSTLEQGKLVKIKGFPKDYKVKLFRVVVSTNRTEWIVTNDPSRASSSRHSRGACHAMEDRGVSSRSQTVDGDRVLPVPNRAHPAKPRSVCVAGLESLIEEPSQPERADNLPDQARFAPRLLGVAT